MQQPPPQQTAQQQQAQAQFPPLQGQQRGAAGGHHHGHHHAHHHHHHHHPPPQGPPPHMQATVVTQAPPQNSPASTSGAPGQQQPKVVMYFQPQDPSNAVSAPVFIHQPANFVYSQPTPRMFYPPPAAINQAYVTPTYSTAQTMGYSQPPPPMPNQVAQQRPQTPPNPAAIPGMAGAPMIHGNPYHINPAAAAAATVVSQSHHMQPGVATTLAAPPGPPPHAGTTGQPTAPPYQPPQASTLAQNKPYEKRKRLNAIKIINPETQEEINLDQANNEKAKAEQAPTVASSSSTSEVSNETKDDITSKDDNETKAESSSAPTQQQPTTTTVVVDDSKAEQSASSETSDIPSATSSSVTASEDLDNGKSKQKSSSKKDEENANEIVTANEVTEEPVAKIEDSETTSKVVETSEETDGSCISKGVEETPTAPAAVNDEQVENNHEDSSANAGTPVATTTPDENHQGQASSEADEALENGTNSSAASSTPASKSSSLIKLKYEYPAEQWSPINTAGKKQYGREFLVKLSNDPLSKVKPSNLPNMDIIKDKLNPDKTKFSIPANLNKDWTPGFVKPTTSKTGLNTKGGSRDSKSGNKRAGPPTVINLTLNTNIELNKAENAWRPDALLKEPPTQLDPQQELERSVRSILNKLTPQKFDKLVKKFNELNIDTEDKLKAAIELIFEKAVDEPEFAMAYARMCEVLREKKVKTSENKDLDFRKLLIGRCQKEYERDYMEGFDRAKFEAGLKAAETEEKRKELQLEFEDKERRARRRSLGNIRFIGELYNLKMLTDRIMHEIISNLIMKIDEESLECLCWLLNTIGKVLDQATQAKLSAPPSEEPRMSSLKPFEYYFNEMEAIIKTKPLTSRVRFMLQDVIDLRRNNWKPRREKAGPKTIDQIHKEAEREKTQAQLMEMQPVSGGGGGGGNRGGDRGKRQQRGDRRDFQGQGNDDEWNTVAYRGSNKNANFNEKIDAQKVISLAASSRKDADSMTFGPGNRIGWGKGSGQKTPSQQSSNRFAAMQNSDSFGSEQGIRRNYSASMGNFARSGPGDRSSNHGVSDERQKAIDNVRNFSTMSTNGPGKTAVNAATPSSSASGTPTAVGGPSMSVDFGHASGTRPAPTTVNEAHMAIGQTVLLKGPADLSMDILERKSKNVIDEYLHSGNAESALQDVCADFHPSHMKDVATAMLMKVLEGNSKDMTKTGELLDYLVDKHALLPSQLQNAFFNEVFDHSSDLEIDIPKLWENVAMILGPILASEKSLQPKFLLDSLAHLESHQVPVFLKHVLNSIANIKGRDKAGEMLRRHNVSLSQLMPLDKVSEFMASTGIDFVNDSLRSDLARLLAENPKSNDAIFSWIEKNVALKDRTEQPKEFLRTLARVVAESSLKIDPQRNDHQYLEETFSLRCPLLKKFVDTDVNREKQVLYSLQHLMHDMEHPNKMLTNFFFALYNNDVISDEGFEAWILCEDPSENLGRGVAHKSTTQFFTWLRENDGDEDLED